ncbi:uncharacterized protein DNG_00480 [Cephalotrichum gorgonifer]|uniref:Myb-like domain-containing protein n=1 Tax=Cephalotrichum gorgonifer TaxID=2041049 RepID=A0AAE8MR05_9PEZI|nr:uncharacterized protein DNG_00480 [Cephalotrichum gorgonifer]
MLLPSAFQCDDSDSPQRRTTRLQAALFASPPASPPAVSAQTAFGNIISTCRSLQALISTPPNDQTPTQLPTPPMSHADPPPLRLRLRPRAKVEEESGGHIFPRKRVAKRQPQPQPARGLNKRRRGLDDDMGRDDGEESNDDAESELDISGEAVAEQAEEARPQTPKRARIAPEALPLGLARRDYHDLHLRNQEEYALGLGLEMGGRAGDEQRRNDEWTTEDDRILVELVLEKLKLTKSDWQDCARSLGKDKHSVGRRWRSLMVNGDVGLKTRSSRRARLHSTWR